MGRCCEHGSVAETDVLRHLPGGRPGTPGHGPRGRDVPRLWAARQGLAHAGGCADHAARAAPRRANPCAAVAAAQPTTGLSPVKREPVRNVHGVECPDCGAQPGYSCVYMARGNRAARGAASSIWAKAGTPTRRSHHRRYAVARWTTRLEADLQMRSSLPVSGREIRAARAAEAEFDRREHEALRAWLLRYAEVLTGGVDGPAATGSHPRSGCRRGGSVTSKRDRRVPSRGGRDVLTNSLSG